MASLQKDDCYLNELIKVYYTKIVQWLFIFVKTGKEKNNKLHSVCSSLYNNIEPINDEKDKTFKQNCI